MQVVIDSTCLVRCLYDEELDLSSLGNLTIARATHVEPSNCGSWYADLSPVKGPVLGPFQRRSQALSAEVQWLECNWLVGSGLGPLSSSASAA